MIKKNATVIEEYVFQNQKYNNYSEKDIEEKLIEVLKNESYEHLKIKSEIELIKNLRNKIEKLNNFLFTDNEWKIFFTEILANPNNGIIEKTKIIQEDYKQVVKLDNGNFKNINLIDKKNLYNNCLQVINQYSNKTENHSSRYDVTLLVNGFPLVHIELKKRGVSIKEAFNQIGRYQNESFFAGAGLFEYIQIFVISNEIRTKYYSNTTRKDKSHNYSKSFAFTSYWTDKNNNIINNIFDFAKSFFNKNTILNIITKYCVLTSENMLLVMRPYQIVASESIINKINFINHNNNFGKKNSGGYIWHTTGSGKTLTSFKTAKLITELDFIEKTIFVVDRKDLDYQTIKEYDKFEKGAANSNNSTAILKKQLESFNSKIIVTTIQKLSNFVKNNKNHVSFNKNIVFIFDECHRSQFGKMHLELTSNFKKYCLFGFTGTPIFANNINNKNDYYLKTTEEVFGEKLHSYTIADAIKDQNVLPFKVDFVNTIKQKNEALNSNFYNVDKESAFLNSKRIKNITEYIIKNFDKKTYKSYNYKKITESNDSKIKVLNGFNSILAVSSINAAKKYYSEFKNQLKTAKNKLKVALIYSYSVNEEENDGILYEENNESVSELDYNSKQFLENAIKDYNNLFNTNFDTSSDKFNNYYKDLSIRVKNKEIDILIVVNMFLTGFDSPTLNTLWIDKNLKSHGLIQAFSRTNRILNSIKQFGNIVCFRNLEKETNDAIKMFGNDNNLEYVLLKKFDDYYNGFTKSNGERVQGFVEIANQLLENFSLSNEWNLSNKEKNSFIKIFGKYLKIKNILKTYDEFENKEILTVEQDQEYCGKYIDLREELILNKNQFENKEISDNITFEIELLKNIEINIEYILFLIKNNINDLDNLNFKKQLNNAISSSMNLRTKKELINLFIIENSKINNNFIEWKTFINNKKEFDLKKIINTYGLKEDETRTFLKNSFEYRYIKKIGTDLDKIMPRISRFSNENYYVKKTKIIKELENYFYNYFDI
ncbi:type I restriction endonuclease subunit R [Spiroplasma endosymbiont of Crioceris asparagi]|uniref:type I restriction endonuclease subunit R n=1 Tax=Spiroplasma endosymbiont of Crioceris asparagi TaxID=3066286 RepID=UPI0030CB7DDD